MPSFPLPDFTQLIRSLALGHQLAGRDVRHKRAARPASYGNTSTRQRGQGMIFDSVREYLPGDEVRHIDWQVTARTGAPHLKLYEEERQRTIMLMVDAGESMQFGTRGTFKHMQAARVAALLAGKGLAEKERVGGLAFQLGQQASLQWVQPSAQRRAAHRLLRILSLPSAHSSANTFGRAHPTMPSMQALCLRLIEARMLRAAHAHLVIISDFSAMTPGKEGELKIALGRLARRHAITLIAIDDAADMQLPPVKELAIASSTTQTHIAANHAKLQQIYRHYWQARRDGVAQVARGFNIPFIAIQTSDTQEQLTQTLRQVRL